MSRRTWTSWVVCLFGVAGLCLGADPAPRTVVIEPAQQPATQPSAEAQTQPVKPNVEMTPEAEAELNRVRQAYAKLNSLRLDGRLSVRFEVLGETEAEQADFTAVYQAPNRFKHEINNEIVVGSTGQKVYAHLLEQKEYLQADAPAGGARDDWPGFVKALLQGQNPSLLMAMSPDAGMALLEGGTKLERLADEKIGDRSYTQLGLQTPSGEQRFWFDPDTHLMRRARFDLSKALEQRGVQAADITVAEMAFDYSTVGADAAVKEEVFAWTAPQGARDVSELMAAAEEEGKSELEGKAAPAFELSDLAGKPVKLSDHKGQVVVLDFWATWCPPCIQAMPILEKIHKERSAAGVRVLAINVQEDRDKVAAFMKQRELSMPALLDSKADVARQYNVSAIPQTVIIGKDGLVKKVMIGLHSEEQLVAEIEAAMK